MTVSGSVGFLANTYFIFSLWLNKTPVCALHFIRSSGARHPGCFHSWAAMNSAAVGMGEQAGIPVVCLVLWVDAQVRVDHVILPVVLN